MASKDPTTTPKTEDTLPFGTIGEEGAEASDKAKSGKKGAKKAAKKAGKRTPRGKSAAGKSTAEPDSTPPPTAGEGGPASQDGEAQGERPKRRKRKRRRGKGGEGSQGGEQPGGGPQGKGRGKGKGKGRGGRAGQPGAAKGEQGRRGRGDGVEPVLASGMFVLEKGGIGVLRREEAQYKPSKEDIYVSKRLLQKNKLRDGSLVTGHIGRGQKHKFQLLDVQEVDGKEPGAWANLNAFKNLTSIDPDFHYAVGDITDEVSMRIVDLLCPVGRGQRGLLVAPPRSGKTTLLRQFARGIELGYPDVRLMILLVDERPEEATEWKRSIERGQVFVSTADETSKNHILLAEAVWKRACRLVELGEDVVILLDSITRLARAYNNQAGSGRTMSGGLDSRAMERPRKIFGSARNTVEAGSLTILGSTLVQTGSRMDQLVFEEFKGTGNMELVLNRKLADRRIFPAIDVEKTGTRKEEKLVGMRRLKLLHTLHRVLARMNFIEAMELLITRLEEVDKTDDFLSRFEVDPEA